MTVTTSGEPCRVGTFVGGPLLDEQSIKHQKKHSVVPSSTSSAPGPETKVVSIPESVTGVYVAIGNGKVPPLRGEGTTRNATSRMLLLGVWIEGFQVLM